MSFPKLGEIIVENRDFFIPPTFDACGVPLEKGPLIERVVVVAQDIEEDLTEEGGDCCELSCFQPSPDVVPPEMSEDYFTAVFNTERIEMSVIH